MTDQPTEMPDEEAPKDETSKGAATENLIEEKTRRGWSPLKVILAGFVAVIFVCFAISQVSSSLDRAKRTVAERQAQVDERQAVVDADSAYYDVLLNLVAVNGERGTSTWRSYYRLGLERVLSSHDFSDDCTYNGFLKDSSKVGTLPCIAADDVRAVRSNDGAISYFRESRLLHTVKALDVMEQDVHADDYLDIDKFSTALGDRARRIVQEVEDRKREKEMAEQEASFEDTRRLIAESNRIVAETERLLGRRILPTAPPINFEQGQNRP